MLYIRTVYGESRRWKQSNEMLLPTSFQSSQPITRVKSRKQLSTIIFRKSTLFHEIRVDLTGVCWLQGICCWETSDASWPTVQCWSQLKGRDVWRVSWEIEAVRTFVNQVQKLTSIQVYSGVWTLLNWWIMMCES